MRSELERRTHDQKLMAALAFDDEDLDANRHGYMSKRQRSTLSKNRKYWKALILLVILAAPIAMTFAISEGIRIQDTVSSRIGICILIIFLSCAVSFYFYTKVRNYNHDLLKGYVVRVGGVITEYPSGERGQAALRIGGQVFRTSRPEQFFGFDYGDKYTIFYAPFSKYILSAQLLEQPTTEREAHPILKANPPIK